ncbi:STM3941 family protein [Flavobacterium swingsii]|nr:STM3941 family protein [Flavobacterium swingsii]
MTEIKLYKTTTKGLKIIGMCLPFVAIGIWMIMDNPYGSTEYIMGWFGTCFFGLGIPVGLFQTFDKRPQILITEKGIWDRTTNQTAVKWEQIIEAYPLDIHGQKFISLVTDDTFVFKKKPYKWAAKINKFVGAQNLNLHLGQINIDEIELTNFINQLSLQSIDERRKTIKTFKVKRTNFSLSDLQKILIYIFISLIILILTLSSFVAFLVVMGVSGVSALTARWQPDNAIIRKYAGIVTWLGFLNMVLLFGTMKIYDNVTEEVGEKLAIEIEEFQKQNTSFPTEINSITSKLESNIIERIFIEQIDYKPLDNDYEIEATMIFGKRKKYDKNNGEWR